MSKKDTESISNTPSESHLRYPNDFVNKFICGNAVAVMKQIPNSCVDIVVTSPPYNLKTLLVTA